MNQIVILAGGKGTRMQSELPKVLHPVKGISIIERIINNIKPIFAEPIILVGYKGNEVMSALGKGFRYVFQPEQAGAGHAIWCVKQAIEKEDFDNIVVIPGDHPLLSTAVLEKLVNLHKLEAAKVSLATVAVPNFEGDLKSFFNCGRIIRDENGVMEGIVELKDTTEEQKEIKELNVSYYAFNASWLWKNIEKLNKENKAGEYYLTDMVKIAHENGDKISSFIIDNYQEGLGVNDREQLKIVESYC